jgi:hypothetical protein
MMAASLRPTTGSLHHPARHRERIAHMLEQEARVHHVEATPLVALQGKALRVAMAQLDEVALARFQRLRVRLRDLLGASLDAHSAAPGPLRERPRELPEAAPHVEHALAAGERGLAQRGVVEQLVQQR